MLLYCINKQHNVGKHDLSGKVLLYGEGLIHFHIDMDSSE